MVVYSRFSMFIKRHPVVRGMITYGTIWPTSCIIQQRIAGKRWEDYDWAQALRFSLYGAFFCAPAIYTWLKFVSKMWPDNNLKTAIKKVLQRTLDKFRTSQQMIFSPTIITCFFFGMSILDGKNIGQTKEEVKMKLWPTYKVGVCFWPFVQTYNLLFIPERNRVPFVGVFSLIWSCFLAHMHSKMVIS